MNRKYLFPFAIVFLSVALISWGVIGHRAIARIAEHHLTPSARAAVKELLRNETLSEVSTWPDEVRSQPEYKNTGSWHYINLPLGLSYPEFVKQVEGMTKENVYSALRKCEALLANPQASKEQKVVALKFVVHFVGDLHQPMHVSREEDQGGNKIQVNYDGKGTNLHSLWDSRLIEHQGLNDEQLAQKYDQITPGQIKEWQGDLLIKWIWESYQASTKLYTEIDQLNNRTLDDAYYQSHMPIIEDRIKRAGIRLAGVLNEIFKNGLKTGGGVSGAEALSLSEPAVSATSAQPAGGALSGASAPAMGAAKSIDIKEIPAHMGENVTVCSKVFGYKVLDNSGMTLVNLGAAYPDQLLTVVLKGDPATYHVDQLNNTTLCATGKLIEFKGKPEIVVTDPKMIGGTPH
ncbi:MAG TPA: S1/P1 nuclease [Puia sp.]|nr:S1/P1 nuclease [Puia sp.]